MLRPIAVLALLFVAAGRSVALEHQNTQALAERLSQVHEAALLHSRSYAWLNELTSTIGPRVTGSPAADEATRWAVKTMQDIGLQHVHAEEWQLERGWHRGPATASIIAPTNQLLTVTSYGWCGSTSRPSVDASVIRASWDRYEEFRNTASAWAGRIVLLTNTPDARRDPLAEYAHLAEVVSIATNAGAAGIISRNHRPTPPPTHTDPVAFGRTPDCSLPVLDIAAADEQRQVQLLDAGAPVRIRLSVQNTFSPGPVRAANVVGDIPGARHPDQTVVIGAHLDSWDLSVGALDDGSGVAAVLGAADALVRSGVRPQRTIRFVLFTGEEQGLLGSRHWIDAHRGELGKVLAAVVMDWGSGPITGVALEGHDELAPDSKAIAAAMAPFVQLAVRDGYLTYTDAFSFTLAGLPGLAVIQDSPTYASLAHSNADTLAAVDAQVLVRNTAIFAMLALGLADSPTRDFNRWKREEVAQRLQHDGQLNTLHLLGLWPPQPPR